MPAKDLTINSFKNLLDLTIRNVNSSKKEELTVFWEEGVSDSSKKEKVFTVFQEERVSERMIHLKKKKCSRYSGKSERMNQEKCSWLPGRESE